MRIERELTEEERALKEGMSRSSWKEMEDEYRARDLDQLVARYAPDAISIPANHHALQGHDEIRAWYATRTGDYEMNVTAEVDSVDIVGDLAVVVGIFRVTRRPEEGVAGLDHGGRFLSVMRKIDGEWRMWRDMDSPSPDADVFYDRLPRGW
jgi:ketosteroid isomerase-like protein